MAASGGANVQVEVEKSERLAAAEGIKEWMIDIRNQIQKNPEIASELVKATLKEQLIVHVYDDETYATERVVARVGSEIAPVNVVLGAYMDAEPLQKLYAGGNGAQTAMLLGAAKLLQECYQKKEFEGAVILLFQPSKEKGANISTITNGILNGQEAIFRLGVTDATDSDQGYKVRDSVTIGGERIEGKFESYDVDMSEHGSASQETNDPKEMEAEVQRHSTTFNPNHQYKLAVNTTGASDFLKGVASEIYFAPTHSTPDKGVFRQPIATRAGVDQPKFLLDEDMFPSGAAMLTATAIKYLANPS